MKQLLFVLVLFGCASPVIKKQPARIKPDGTYELVSKTVTKGDDIYGYSGKVQAKELEDQQIILSFFITKGAPSYNLGSFVDTLAYRENTAVYTYQLDSNRCQISFRFTTKGIEVKQGDDASYCGFGNGVIAHGFFKKTSSETPVITDLATGEKID